MTLRVNLVGWVTAWFECNTACRPLLAGKLVILIASDATRVMWCIPWLHFLPTGLFQLIGSILFLYSLLGPSILAGLAVTLVSAPLMSYLVKKNNQCARANPPGHAEDAERLPARRARRPLSVYLLTCADVRQTTGSS